MVSGDYGDFIQCNLHPKGWKNQYISTTFNVNV